MPLFAAVTLFEPSPKIYQSHLPYARVRVIPRVGYDVRASCGMFFAPDGPTQEQIGMRTG